VLEASDTLFNKRDYDAASRFWSDTYIQHSAHIEPGRDGLFNLIRSAPDTRVTSINSSSRKATTSSSTAVSRAMAGPPPGSPWTC
jgi:predicted SnoaL-like aldol condensation-catalyzing enzyme